jgi:small-conductance mechanosensitive channel
VRPARFCLLTSLSLGLLNSQAHAGQTPQEAVRDPALIEAVRAEDAVLLTYANRPITTLRARILANLPAERAEVARALLDELVKSRTTGPISTRFEQGIAFIRVGNRDVLTLVPADVNPLSGDTLERKAAGAASALEKALTEAAELGRPRHLFFAALRSIGGSLVFGVAVVGLLRLRRRITTRLLPETERRLERLLPGEFASGRSSRLDRAARRAVTALSGVGLLILAYWWISFVLRQFPYTRPWGESLRGYLFDLFSRLGLSIVHAIPGLFTAAIILFITRVLVHASNTFFENVERRSVSVSWVHSDTANATRILVSALLWLLGLVLAYPYLPGSNTDAFKGVSVFIGLIVSLGSSGIVNQIMSGLTLTYARALRPGDIIRIGDVEGMVTALNIFSVKVRTFHGEEVTVPNSVVISQPTTNFTKLAPAGGALLGTSVTIGYDRPWRQVRALLMLAAERTTNVRKDPPPRVLKESLDDSYVRYRLVVCLDDPLDRRPTLDRLHSNILDAFNEYGVQITSPNYEGDPEKAKVVPRDQWHEAPAQPERE